MLTGLVLEGGAMRGLFTAGVLDVLMENQIELDGAIGVSAGAVFGCNYQSGQIGRTLRYNLRFCHDWRYCSVRSLLLTGDLYGAKFCYWTLPLELDLFDYEAYAANPHPFYVVCTDCETGEAVYRLCRRADGDEREWFRASASMPLASRVVEVNGKKLLDGGIADSVPIRYFESIGYERNVVVLTQPEGFVKTASRGLTLMKKLLRKYPNVAKTMGRRHDVYNETSAYIAQREKEGAAFVIRPPRALDMSRTEHDPAKLQAAYDLGRQEMLKRLKELKSFLAQK
ncbi:MAG: patatin family protein [Clostridia bacterium]|nr:patatin family protein [Clostridia bacterium]